MITLNNKIIMILVLGSYPCQSNRSLLPLAINAFVAKESILLTANNVDE
jgi:hypothetical protein